MTDLTDEMDVPGEYYAMAPNGVVHRIVTQTFGELKSVDNFRRLSQIHGYMVKEGDDVDAAIEEKPLVAITGEREHSIQYAFAAAAGQIVTHSGAQAFYDAIGYTDDLRARCGAEHNRYIKDGWLPGGGWEYRDPGAYRVELPQMISLD